MHVEVRGLLALGSLLLLMYVLGVKLRLLGLVISTFTTEPCQPDFKKFVSMCGICVLCMWKLEVGMVPFISVHFIFLGQSLA